MISVHCLKTEIDKKKTDIDKTLSIQFD